MVAKSGVSLLMALLMTAGLAGCVADAEVVIDLPPTTSAGFEVGSPVLVDTRCPCFESNIAVGPDGWTYVTAARLAPLLVSEDGTNFTAQASPPIPFSAPFDSEQNDAMVVAGADGTLHFHALLTRWYSGQQGVGGMLLYGIQYARSADHGATWDVNVYHAFPATMGLPQLGADRQWLTIADDGTLYLTHQRIPIALGVRVLGQPVPYMGGNPLGLWVSRSDDGGATWTPFQSITDQNYGVINGQPVVDQNGTLYVPYFVPTPKRLYVAVSTDRGENFEHHVVYAPEGASPGSWFPSLKPLPDGGLVMVWNGADDILRVATSHDGAATWTEPAVWDATGNTSVTSPWAFVLADQLVVLWYAPLPDDQARLMATRAPLADLSNPVETVQVGPAVQGWAGKEAYTDFAHGAVTPDGKVRAVWGAPEGSWLADLAVGSS